VQSGEWGTAAPGRCPLSGRSFVWRHVVCAVGVPTGTYATPGDTRRMRWAGGRARGGTLGF
jgi:hypothetical protein